MTTLIIPGLYGSDADHWQSWFEGRVEGCVRVIQSNWKEAYLPLWTSAVRRELNRVPGDVWLVAHSFGCLAAVQAGWDYRERIAGAMLVAPADPETFGVSDALPDRYLGFPSLVVASVDDPWMPLSRARHWAETWGSRFVEIGLAGHVNVASGHGPWPEGLRLFETFQNRIKATDEPLGDDIHLRLGDI